MSEQRDRLSSSSSTSSTSGRSLRSNTDKSLEPLPPILNTAIEKLINKSQKSNNQVEQEGESNPISQITTTNNPEESSTSIPSSESSESSEQPSDPSSQNTSSNETTILEANPPTPILEFPIKIEDHKPIMSDSIEDLIDDRTSLSERVAAIQTILDHHQSTEFLISKERLEIGIEELQTFKVELDQLRKRTRKLYRGSNGLNNALASDIKLYDEIIKATLDAATIKKQFDASVVSRVKIPKAEPPLFDGTSIQWNSFYDQFSSMVVDNDSVSFTDKLSLLKKALENGSAYPIVQNFPLTDVNWHNAWEAVKSRYNHQRELAYSHLNKLFELTPLTFATQVGIRNIIDTVNDVIRGLNNLKVDTTGWDLFLTHIMRKNLDNRTRTDFEKSLSDDKIHSLKVLMDYLNNVATALGTASMKQNTTDSKNAKPESSNSTSNGKSTNQSKISCSFCEKKHFNSSCPSLIPLTPVQRSKLAGDKKLCKNCLRVSNDKHKTTTCNSAPCGLNGCQQKHHQLLHFESQPVKAASLNTTASKNAKPTTSKGGISIAESLSAVKSENNQVTCLLATAVVNIVINNKSHQVRAVIDQGSQVNVMTDKLANKLQLKRQPSTMSITGIGNTNCAFAKGQVTRQVQSIIDPNWTQFIDFHILPEVTRDKPNQYLDISTWEQFKNLKLADEKFNQPGPVDLLLGTQVFMDILGSNHIRGLPSALDTKLGYLIMGNVNVSDLHQEVTTLTCDVNFDLSRFWQQEEVPSKKELSQEDVQVESHFLSTHQRTEEGRFIVQFPFMPIHKPLGESRAQAVRRLIQVEHRLQKYPEKKALYHKAMSSYLSDGHIVQVPFQDINNPNNQVFYLPHHFVEKESTSTPLRVVFDGSAKSTSGVSLNDIIRVGPTIQNELVDILLKFREHKYVFTCDLKKMYLQIKVHPPHQDYLRVLWRESPKHPIKDYKFTVVPFGTSSSPYLAIRSVQQLAKEHQTEFPLGADAILNDLYVDDCLTGDNTLIKTKAKQSQVREISSKGQFQTCKFSSNHPSLLESVPEEDRETQLPLEIDSTDSLKTLGILWDPARDIFKFKVNPPKDQQFTKRKVASYAAKTYDPTGLIQPIIIIAKIILQQLWESKVEWDQVIPDQMNNSWTSYLQQLPDLEQITIPRHIFPSQPEKVIAHGFSDASKLAYGAAIYIQSFSSSQVSSQLLTSKSKVAPLRVVTIPRLELMGAVLLSKLMESTKSSLRTVPSETHYWCDSTIVLNQIQKSSRNFRTFVGNRVAKIQEKSDTTNWHYVKTSENPADLVSRGVAPADLINNKFWWNGPSWLETHDLPIGPIPGLPPNTDLEEIPISTSLSTEVSEQWPDTILKNFNSLIRLKRVTSLVLRIFKVKDKPKYSTFINVPELNHSMEVWIKVVQFQHFSQELKWLNQGKQFPKGHKLIPLNPFINEKGILLVGGRLQEAQDIPEEMKHPAILPKNHPLVKIIIQDIHVRYKHAGVQLMTAIIRSHYWILGLRTSISRCIKNCLICQKVSAEVGAQMMGNLPKFRVSQSRPFLHTGVDYMGPILILPKSGRGQKLMKAWIAVFVCFSVKAVHLELVSELSTSAFMAALKRFVSRRGKPNTMYSDEGTNFVGARNQLISFQQEMEQISNHHDVAQSLAADGINWKLNPPGSPHMGGLWESAVKSLKHHLRRAGESTNFTIEEMTTLLCEIEACLNSRPLTPMTNDPNDYSVLTPGHFLIGEPLISIPGHDLTQTKMSRLNRWELIQQQKTHFWKRWSSEYLHTLQNRPKWATTKVNFEVGELVLIKDESLPPLKWKVGRIQEVHPGKDGQVRVATVKVVTIKINPHVKSLDKFQSHPSTLKRPIHKLIRLPYYNPNQELPNSSTANEYGN